MIHYYFSGIFKGGSHPFKKTELSKLNPLQRITYSLLKLFLILLQVITGLLYLYYNNWPELGLSKLSLGFIRALHVLGAFLLTAFIIVHIYLTTTGKTIFSNIKVMITGWEEVDESE